MGGQDSRGGSRVDTCHSRRVGAGHVSYHTSHTCSSTTAGVRPHQHSHSWGQTTSTSAQLGSDHINITTAGVRPHQHHKGSDHFNITTAGVRPHQHYHSWGQTTSTSPQLGSDHNINIITAGVRSHQHHHSWGQTTTSTSLQLGSDHINITTAAARPQHQHQHHYLVLSIYKGKKTMDMSYFWLYFFDRSHPINQATNRLINL